MPARLHCNRKTTPFRKSWYKANARWVTVEGSRLTYDMPQLTSQRLVTNAYEALKQLPGVIEQNDVLTLAGAGGVSLLLNGRPSSMTYEQLVTLLKGIPASRVEKAEVMYSAPPQYTCAVRLSTSY